MHLITLCHTATLFAFAVAQASETTAPTFESSATTTFASPTATESTAHSSADAVESTAHSSADAVATGCHLHGAESFCFVGGEEYEIITPLEGEMADEYLECHFHDEELHCVDDGNDVTLAPLEGASHEHGSDGEDASHEHDSDSEESASATVGEVSCHSHAGVEHCVDAEGNTVSSGCARPEYDYDVPLRVGLLFVILISSAIGVLGPILTSSFTNFDADHIVLLCARQFGTGIIISTALVHLYTHAQLFFSNECLGGLKYEGTTSAVVMAGLFVTFLIEYITHRMTTRQSTTPTRQAALHDHRVARQRGPDDGSNEKQLAALDAEQRNLTVQVTVMELGIIFHSILIGLTLVVANDSGFISLFIVILFHQMLEGIALGSRITMIPAGLARKLIMAAAFAVTTPIGMAIGIGVLNTFNGNDPSTMIAIATLDAFSAGILLWVGVVGMLFTEWFLGALAKSGVLRTSLAILFLVSGLAVMSLLGKWA